jgi:hypothetical protein
LPVARRSGAIGGGLQSVRGRTCASARRGGPIGSRSLAIGTRAHEQCQARHCTPDHSPTRVTQLHLTIAPLGLLIACVCDGVTVLGHSIARSRSLESRPSRIAALVTTLISQRPSGAVILLVASVPQVLVAGDLILVGGGLVHLGRRLITVGTGLVSV